MELAWLDVARATFVEGNSRFHSDPDLLGVPTRICVRVWVESWAASGVYG
jgi:hypothetical protein